jgi:hypothetical protein
MGRSLINWGLWLTTYCMVQSTLILVGTAPQWRHYLVIPETGEHMLVFAFWEGKGAEPLFLVK